MTGKFRNKRVVVKEIDVDEHNLPTVNGRGILKIRIEKLMNPKVNKKEIKESVTKIYNKFTDKFGNEYGFDNYMDFAKFWFNLPIRKQKEYFPDSREQLQRAAADSKEARTKYTKIGEQNEVNIGRSIPVKIQKDGDRYCIYRIEQPTGEEVPALNRDFGSKQEAERTAKLRGFVLVNDKGDPQEYEADTQPQSLKTTKEKVEYVLEVVRKTMRLHELDVTGTDLEAEVEEYGRLSDQIDRLNAEIKKLEVRFKELDAKFVLMLETLETELGNSKETFIRAKNILITIKRKGTERTTFKYKEAFDWLYERVSPQMKKLINETMEAHKTVSMVKSSLGVQREGKIDESWISDLYNKVKSFFVGIIAKLRNTNKTANQALDKLEQMV